MQSLVLRRADGPVRADLEGTLLRRADVAHFRMLRAVDGNVRVSDGDGSTLAIVLRRALSPSACLAAADALRSAARSTDNRGAATGRTAQGSLVKMRGRRSDGAESRTTVSRKSVESGIVGYFDRYPRTPFCRETTWTRDFPDRFSAALPFIREVDNRFREHVPERYAAQRAVVDRVHRDFKIDETAFTTITVNRNFQTAVHKDAGDVPDGFGVMAAFRFGKYRGGEICFPEFVFGVDLETTDLLLANVHEWHANAPFLGTPGRYERISTVLYARKNMVHCKSAPEELERVKSRKVGDHLRDEAPFVAE